MPTRSEPLITGNTYHLFNKMIDQKRVFQSNSYSQDFYDRLIYYRSINSTRSYSDLSKLHKDNQENIYTQMFKESDYQVRILAYCFMPNHYHLLIQQLKDDGISNYISKTTNSFTRYYNLKNQRRGQVFLKDFKAVLVRSDEQLIHNSRYIHLNPYSSGLVTTPDELIKYRWSSFASYLGVRKDKLVQNQQVMSFFSSVKEYQDFVFDQAEYQKELEEFKHIDKFTTM